MTHEVPSPPTALDGATIDINLIRVDRGNRQRREIDSSDLQASIRRVGLLAPLVVTRQYELKAGERRYDALRTLGWTRVPVRFFESLDPIEGQIVELEENVKRRALPWQDEVAAIARIHDLYKGRDADHTVTKTSEQLGLTKGHISMSLRVAQNLGEERIAKAGGAREAWNILARRDQRAMGDQLAELLAEPDDEPDATHSNDEPGGDDNGVRDEGAVGELGSSESSDVEPKSIADVDPGDSTFVRANVGPSPAAAPFIRPAPAPALPDIRQGSFLDWLSTDGPEQLKTKFSLVHCDFPYGINLFDGGQGRGSEPAQGYADSEDIYWTLLEAFCKNLDRFMSVSAHLVFWFSGKHRAQTMAMFRNHAPSIEFYPYDLVWHKSDNAGIAGDQRRHPRHTHETALLGSRGRRHIVQVVADSYSGPTNKTFHPSTKPEPMLRHFFQMFVDPETRVFDPTCGAGSALRAADSLGAKQVLGLELDPEHARVALRELDLARGLRRASAKAGGAL